MAAHDSERNCINSTVSDGKIKLSVNCPILIPGVRFLTKNLSLTEETMTRQMRRIAWIADILATHVANKVKQAFSK